MNAVRRPPFFPPSLLLLLILVLAAAPGCSVVRGHKDRAAAGRELPSGRGAIGQRGNAAGLAADMRFSPDPVKLGETRQIDVAFTVRNVRKSGLASLKFATSQRLEILLRDPASGRVLTQWSADRTFDPTGGYLILNAGERLEFNQAIVTRELKAGATYNLEAYVVGYDKELRAVRVVIPQP